MKIKQYLEEATVSGNVDSYDVPYASGNGYHRTDIPVAKRNKQNIPMDSENNPEVNLDD
jgi:hypothetical protein